MPLLILLGEGIISFKSKFESGNQELKYCREAGIVYLLEINTECNFFQVIFSNLRSNYF